MNSEPAEAVNAEPPATPEPAAPMPRVSPEWVATYAMPTSLHGPAVRDLALDLIDERARSTAAMDALAARCEVVYVEVRAKVAELEARIADHAAQTELRRLQLEDADAALARANEALTRSRAFVHYGCSCGEGITDGRCARMNAQGSAAQKPEPRDAG